MHEQLGFSYAVVIWTHVQICFWKFIARIKWTRAGVYEALCPQHMLAPEDNLETMLLYYIKCQSWKREIIQPNMHRILPNLNHVIYTLDTICLPNSMILGQVVLQIFCSQGRLWVKCTSLKRGIIQSNFDRIVWKVDQVIYIMYPNCMAYIKILVQALLQIFCSQDCFTTQNTEVEKGR